MSASERKLPRDPRTGEALPPRPQPGYYPGFSTLSQQDFWDEATRRVVLARVGQVPPLRFFNAAEARLLQAVLDRVMPQDDRDLEHRIPVLNLIDERLHARRFDGYQFEGMPEETEAHRSGLVAIDRTSHATYRKPFLELTCLEQDSLLQSIRDGKPEGAEEIWEKLPISHYWSLLMQDAASAYYAHPYAWDEIGFGGPAYPRGYMRLEKGLPEPWERAEKRYEWKAPEDTVSDRYRLLESEIKGGHSGQGGTH